MSVAVRFIAYCAIPRYGLAIINMENIEEGEMKHKLDIHERKKTVVRCFVQRSLEIAVRKFFFKVMCSNREKKLERLLATKFDRSN
jgi:hypothetical protein